MTQRAHIHLAVSRELCRVDDRAVRSRLGRRFGLIPRDVFAAWAMAFLARDSQHETGLIVAIDGRRDGLERRRVTFEAARRDRPGKNRGAVRESRTVHPLTELRPIRYRQLKELVFLPKRVA